MGGFNTLIFVGQPKAVGTTYTPTWDDQLHVATAIHSSGVSSCGYNSNGQANRANWSDGARTISVWKAQASNLWGGGTAAFKLYDSTASVTIYAANFGSLGSRASASLTGNPLATYTLPVNNIIKMTDNGSTTGSGYGSAAAILFSSVPSGAATFDFNGSSDLLADGMYVNFNGILQPSAHTAVIASFSGQKTVSVYKIQFANASDVNSPSCSPQALSRSDSFKIYDSTASVTIYTVTNSNTPANDTASIVGNPLTTYTLPSGNNLSIDVNNYTTPGSLSYDDLLGVGMVMSAT